MSVLDETLCFDPAVRLAAQPGRVTLVGAGPGDPDLLTVKAARALAACDLVLHDALVGEGVLALVPKTAHCIDVGKRSGCHKLSQDGIIELMVRLAKSGRNVLRLKGGDPFIFGRGGEEAEALAAAGIPFEVVPGISAAQGAAAATGLPLTHRDHARSLVFVTGHAQTAAGPAGGLELDWPQLARPHQTLVVYMGVETLPLLCAKLVAHGLAPNTPACTIENATRPEQRVVTGTVETLPLLARVHGVKPPALVVIGEVVALQPVLAAAMVAAA
ncbi:MAG: uroporphyrinogen-III C-methyltransferase [Rubrivivax sp.]